jgi:hypothetical protein
MPVRRVRAAGLGLVAGGVPAGVAVVVLWSVVVLVGEPAGVVCAAPGTVAAGLVWAMLAPVSAARAQANVMSLVLVTRREA